jgi:hypothetical protein
LAAADFRAVDFRAAEGLPAVDFRAAGGFDAALGVPAALDFRDAPDFAAGPPGRAPRLSLRRWGRVRGRAPRRSVVRFSLIAVQSSHERVLRISTQVETVSDVLRKEFERNAENIPNFKKDSLILAFYWRVCALEAAARHLDPQRRFH